MTEEKFKKEVFVLKDKLFRFAFRFLSDADEAQDVTQDVLLKLWNMRKELGQYKSIEALAMTTTKNMSLDRIRKRNTRFEKEPEIQYEAEKHTEANALENKELGQMIRQVIQQLEEPQRSIIHLRDVEGYSFEEIEPLVQMKTETIRVNLSRARKKVREELKKIMEYEAVRS